MIVRYGPFHPALEEALVLDIKEILSRGPAPICVVVPSRRLALRLERLLAVEKQIPLLNVHFHTFYSLAWSILREEEPLDGVFISEPLFFNRLVDSLAETELPDSLWPKKSKRPKAFSESLRSSLRDLIDAGLVFDDLSAYQDELEFEGSQALKSLSLFAQLYREKLKELKIFSMAELVRLAAQKSEKSRFLGQFQEIIYYGFYDLTGLQLDFFENVTKSHPCRLFFPYAKSHPAFAFAKDFFEQKLAAHDLTELGLGFEGRPLGTVLENLFASSLKPVLAAPPIRLVSASGIEDEIWFAAKEILRLVEEEKVGFDEIGVVFRSLDFARSSIARVFEENKIVYDMKAQEPMLRRPLAKTLFNFLSLARRDFPAFSVEDVISSPYFDPGNLAREWTSEARRIIRSLKMGGGWLQWKGRLSQEALKKMSFSKDFSRESAAFLWEFLLFLKESLNHKPLSWSDFSKTARALIEKFFKLPKDASSQEIETWELFMSGLESLSLLDRISRPKDFSDALDALEEKLKRSSFETSSGTIGVRVMDAMAARGESFRVLFILGLNEGIFPRAIVEDPILKDPARAFLRHPAGYWIRPKKEGYEEEKLLFYLLVSSAQEKLYCAYSRSNEEGKEQVPSFYLYELAQAAHISLGDSDLIRVPRDASEKLQMIEPRYLSPAEMSLYACLQNASAVPFLAALNLPQAELLEVGLKAAEELNLRVSNGERDGIVETPNKFLGRLREGVSPTSLEVYTQCPFRFFAARVLELSEDEKNSKDEISPQMIGQIYHDILRRFYSSWSHFPNPVLEGKKPYDDLLDRAIEESFSEYDENRLGVYPLLWLSVKNNISERLRKLVELDIRRLRQEKMRPFELEKEFRADIPHSVGYQIRGRLDRIDESLDGNMLEIIDYKKSWKKGDPKKLVLGGEFFQIPFYLELLSHAYPGKEIKGASLYELEGGQDEISAYPYSFSDWQNQRELFLKNLSKILNSIERGYFPINPDDESEYGHCRYCRFPNLCRKKHSPSRRRGQEFLKEAFAEKQT